MSMIGKTLGSFECAALLGKGGMGEAWKAHDPRLNRTVAIKKVKAQHSERSFIIRQTQNIEAYNLYLKGRHHFYPSI